MLITTGIFPPDIGGPATYIPRFGEFLTSNNFEVEVVTLSETSVDLNSPFHFSVHRIMRSKKRLIRVIITVITIMNKLKDSNFLFSNGLYLETALALRLSSFHGPSLVKIVGDPVWERAQRNSVKTSTIYGKIERKLITWSLRQFDCVTTPGENLARTVESWSKKITVRVVQNGVQVLTRETSERKRFDLIVISRLVGWKNVDTVIAIANQLGCSLAIVGDGPQRKSLEIHASGNSNIVFFGARTNEEIQDLLKQSRVFCQLSDYEGLSFSLLQAMACSLPCVLSDIKANREVFEQDEGAAVFVHNRDSEGISTAISSLLHSRQIQNDLGVRAARIVRQSFNEADKMREMMELLINHD